MEEELYQAQATEQAQDKTNQYIIQKLTDRDIAACDLLVYHNCCNFCTRRIPEALGLPRPCTVE